MTTRPRLYGGEKVIGVLAIGLFGFLSAVFLTSGFGTAAPFPDGSVTASIGYALLNLEGGGIDSEGFLVAFITIAIVLDAALDGAIMLAKKEGDS